MTVPDAAAMGCDPRSPDGEVQRKQLTAALRVAIPEPREAIYPEIAAYLRDPPVHVPLLLREAWAALREMEFGSPDVEAYRLALVWCLSAICYTHLGPGKREAAALHVREVLRCAVDARVAHGAWAWVAALRVWLAYRVALWRLRRW